MQVSALSPRIEVSEELALDGPQADAIDAHSNVDSRFIGAQGRGRRKARTTGESYESSGASLAVLRCPLGVQLKNQGSWLPWGPFKGI